MRALSRSAERLGADADAFARGLGIDAATRDDEFASGEVADRALDELAAKLGDPAVGLSLARVSPIGSFGLVDYCAVTSKTLRDALKRTSRFYGLLTERVSLVLEERDGEAHLYQRVRADSPRSTTLAEFAFALVYQRMADALGARPALRAVRFVHQPSDPAPYEATFGPVVSFGAPEDELVFDAALLDTPLCTADRTASELLDDHAHRLRASALAADPFLERVRAAVERAVREKDASLERIARELRTSRRTLQRQLQEHGTSHREMLDAVRRDMATALLANKDVSPTQVALELGFTQAAPFYRAFGRWTGTTPGAFRSRLVAAMSQETAPQSN